MEEQEKILIQRLLAPKSPHDVLEDVLSNPFQAHLDLNDFLQINPEYVNLSMSPLSPFFTIFRQLVMDAYSTPLGLKADPLGRKLHLFRSYLDRFYLNYLQRYYGKNDYQRLLNFARDHHLRLDYETDSRYHNRIYSQFNYPLNMKVQLARNSWRCRNNPARMIEFIFDIDSGQVISEWNGYRFLANQRIDSDPKHYSGSQLAEIANTESFNYGIPHGPYFVYPWYYSTHRYLDVIQPQNSLLRQRAKRQYRAPQSYRHGGQFVDLISAGGIKDVIAWRQIPLALRKNIYHDFWAHLINSGSPNWGINYYLGSTMKYHQYFIY